MLTKTDKFLIQSVLLFITIVFTAMTASAACTEAEKAAFTCAEIGGYELRIDTDTFPTQDDVSTTFSYKLIPLQGTTKNVSMIDMLVPVCRDNNAIVDVDTGPSSGWYAYPAGEGSSSTNFGEGVFQYFVFEQTFDSSKKDTFYLASSKASAGPTSFGLKIGPKLEAGEILGPACFDAQTASVVEQVVQLDLFKDPDRIMTIEQDPSGDLLSVSALDGGEYVSVTVKDLKTFPVWVCVYPNLDEGGKFLNCNLGPNLEPGMLPITHMPDGVGRFGENTCYAAFIAGRYAYYCY